MSREFTLAISDSMGRMAPIVTNHADGEITVSDWGGSPCPGCEEMTSPGDPISKVHGSWWHARCAKTAVLMMHPDRAWIALASQVAAYPRRHKSTEIRAVIENLMRIATRALDDTAPMGGGR